MNDQPSDEPAPDDTGLVEDSWLDRARQASGTVLYLVERNPHGAFLTGLPVEPWLPPPHPLHPAK